MTAAASGSPTERYRRERPPVSRECGDELTRITDDIDDPIVKLRYLQNALNEEGDKSALVQLVPIPPARRAWYRLKGLRALDAVADADEEIAERTLAARQTARRVVVGASAAAMLFVPVLVAIVAWQVNRWRSEPSRVATVGSSTEANATAIESTTAPLRCAANDDGDADRFIAPAEEAPVNQPPVAEQLSEEDMGIVPSMVWLADRGARLGAV